MAKIRQWLNRKRKVIWSEPALPKYVKINPMSPPGAGEGLQPGDMSMLRVAEEFLEAEEGETALPTPLPRDGRLLRAYPLRPGRSGRTR
jgi:hypothetical protein